ncbi:hypothetical protein AVEN_240758-1 [Araneus ventricosus]|uniref:Uncharacterized protein n=1 Tax=Araneus ventricosus TaxID=182803 RepID=A0A4Y2U4Z6_ARAVE|nr:hypothetical protein AVEN_126272-1 [Araneus ventricosus]GBO06730.1 hypothetical protein AVEN_240758-1 [Araneus ventricosus]
MFASLSCRAYFNRIRIVGEVREKINKIAKFFEQRVKSGTTINKKIRNEIAEHFIDLSYLVRKFSNDLKVLRLELYQANENTVNKDILVLKTNIKDLETRNKVLESKLAEQDDLSELMNDAVAKIKQDNEAMLKSELKAVVETVNKIKKDHKLMLQEELKSNLIENNNKMVDDLKTKIESVNSKTYADVAKYLLKIPHSQGFPTEEFVLLLKPLGKDKSVYHSNKNLLEHYHPRAMHPG